MPRTTDVFPWRFDDFGGGVTITARQANIPDDVNFPSKGKVYLVWEGTEVRWQFGGESDVPPNSVWALEKVRVAMYATKCSTARVRRRVVPYPRYSVFAPKARFISVPKFYRVLHNVTCMHHKPNQIPCRLYVVQISSVKKRRQEDMSLRRNLVPCPRPRPARAVPMTPRLLPQNSVTHTNSLSRSMRTPPRR